MKFLLRTSNWSPFLIVWIILIASTWCIRTRQIPPYRWNPNIQDIKTEYTVQNTVNNWINTGEIHSKYEYNPSQYLIIPSDTQFYNKSDISQYYSQDKIPYYNAASNTTRILQPQVSYNRPTPKYQLDQTPYYSPAPAPYVRNNNIGFDGVSVKVELGDLWMDIPTEENFGKLKKQYQWLKEKQDNVYYSADTLDINKKINVYNEKIRDMEFQLKHQNDNYDITQDEINEYLMSNMKKVDIPQGWNYTTSNRNASNYYEEEGKQLSEATVEG